MNGFALNSGCIYMHRSPDRPAFRVVFSKRFEDFRQAGLGWLGNIISFVITSNLFTHRIMVNEYTRKSEIGFHNGFIVRVSNHRPHR